MGIVEFTQSKGIEELVDGKGGGYSQTLELPQMICHRPTPSEYHILLR